MFPGPQITRRLRRWLSVWQIVSLLFMQLAVAAYVCPMAQAQTSAVNAEAAQDMTDMTDMPVCQEGKSGMDPTRGALCKAHCEQGEQVVGGLHAGAADAPATAGLLALLDWRVTALAVHAQAQTAGQALPHCAAPPGLPPRYLSLLVLRQ